MALPQTLILGLGYMRHQGGALALSLVTAGKVTRQIWKDAADNVIKSFHN
jgi:hypothetical protein